MERKVIDGGWYADARPSGEWAACRHDGPVVETHLGPLTAPDRPLYVRIPDAGPFRIAGVRHGEGSPELAALKDHVLEWGADGPSWHTHAFKGCGANPVIYDHGGVLRASDCGAGIGSQGFRYATATAVVTGDQTYSPKHGIDLFEWTDLGHGYRVGQGPDDNGAWFYDGQAYYEVITGRARFVRARYADGVVAIACWVEPHRSEIVWATVDEIRATFPAKASPRLETPVPTPTPEPPPPVPEPEPHPMPDTTRLYAALLAERAKYPPRLDDDEQAATIMNDALWTVRDEGWGLSEKPEGNRVWSSEHARYVSYDAVHHQPTNTIYDAATDEWPVMRIVQPHQVEHHRRANRPWLAPVQPTETPAPTPEPVPEPTPVPPPAVDLSAVLTRLAEIEGILADLVEAQTDTHESVRQVAAELNMVRHRPFPTYTGRVLGMGVTLRPEGPA